jgi:regulator of sirC expression with transglutaminase-like and TPR domain
MMGRAPESLREQLLLIASSADEGLATAALCLARLEYPTLDPRPYLERLDAWGREAREHVRAASAGGRRHEVAALARYLFEDLGFTGDRKTYEDLRNSFLNVVLDRRAGIPITLAIVLLELAARAGVPAEGVNFPGHFLDPFHEGALLTESDCASLLRGDAGEDAPLNPDMFVTAGKRQILVRMLLNLKRSYARLRSFAQARAVSDLLLTLEPTATGELRDRGLCAYHLGDFGGALRDLQAYLRAADAPDTEEQREERRQLREHVTTLQRRIASFN